MKTTKTRKLWMGLVAAAAVSTLGLSAPLQSALAHEADCEYCDLPIVQDTKTQDNETKVSVGKKRLEYRCVFCAIAEVKEDFPKSAATIYAPSEKKGKPVILKHVKGKWSASPSSAVFLKAPVKHRQCHLGYRAFTSKAALAAAAKKNGWPNKPLSLSQMVAISK